MSLPQHLHRSCCWLSLSGDFPTHRVYAKDKINSAGWGGNCGFCESLYLEFGEMVLAVQGQWQKD